MRPASWRFSRGAILGPVRLSDSPGTCSEALFWTRGGKGVSVLLFAWFFVFPFLFCFAAANVFLEGPSRRSRRSGQNGWSRPPLGRVIPRGCVFRRGGLVLSTSGILSAYFVSQRVTRTPGAVLSGEGALHLPPQAPFFTCTFLCSRPRFFFVIFFWPSRPRLDSETMLCIYFLFRECIPRMECQIPRSVPRMPRNSPRATRDARQKSSPSPGPPSSDLMWDEGEMLSVF